MLSISDFHTATGMIITELHISKCYFTHQIVSILTLDNDHILNYRTTLLGYVKKNSLLKECNYKVIVP